MKTTDEILDGNKLIAEFMEFKIMYKNGNIPCVDIPYVSCEPISSWAKYHVSWDWLMPVIEKISSHSFGDGDRAYPRTFGMKNDDGDYMVRFNRYRVCYAESFINAAWLAVVDFIKSHKANPIIEEIK